MGQSASWDGRYLVIKYVERKVTSLQSGLLSQSGKSNAAAKLAKLRRAAGKEPGSTPDTWLIEFDGLPLELVGRGNEPSAGEWAVHLALTLYAVHQQSQTSPMHLQSDNDKGEVFGFGHAVHRLVLVSDGGSKSLEAGQMPTRLAAMVTSQTIYELAHYARQIVQQLKAHAIPFDYARFAGQLYDYQNPYRVDQVRLAWAREFAHNPREARNAENESGQETTTLGTGA